MATLVSVNVGLPRDVAWHGQTVHTGVWKHPVTGPRLVRRLNIDGDGQGDLAGHGGEQRAVLVYQLDSYRHWQEELGRDDFELGQFGENFTVDGLPDDEVCIGDRYRIGDAVFEVTQPRVTCYRVGIRLREPRMASLLVSHGRPGFYFRVLTEGNVRAGDEIVKLGTGPEALSVAEINALLYMPGHPRELLERALRIDALSPGWKGSFQALLDGAGAGGNVGLGNVGLGNVGLTAAAAGGPPAWTGFQRLRVSQVTAESDTVFSYTLATTDGRALPAASAGQFVTVRLPRTDASAPLIRTYSLSGAPGTPEYRISVKAEPHGAASGWLHDHAAPGLELDVAAPRGVFTLAGGSGPVVLVSAGVGITPVLAMLHQLAATRAQRRVWWLHGARNSADAIFAEEVRELLAQLPDAQARVCFSRPLPTDRIRVDYTDPGRLSADLVEALGLPPDATAYVCGPATFMDDMVQALAGSGLDPARVRTEAFGAQAALTPGIAAGAPDRAPHPPEDQGDGPVRATVSFSRSGLTVPWRENGPTLLELAEACDVPVRWSCRTGVCHNCETAALSGTVDYNPEPVDDPATGNVLLCCSRPLTDVVLDL
ncbi:MOSC and FAD-binding oxidoreductase domain-containing protein [Streptacidiphilus anmyonensis]|uniref:MOSC and FAD-binding oxidoreductase domain-containing protein n=1 Tax=Streptacidiphilus anmyonensis TaxID=405782 RepID=UPI0005A717C5|nr:MOSC and FAD-binding oxidoreductase domain-containing protein [Streptacidiphilus anmyonensis]